MVSCLSIGKSSNSSFLLVVLSVSWVLFMKPLDLHAFLTLMCSFHSLYSLQATTGSRHLQFVHILFISDILAFIILMVTSQRKIDPHEEPSRSSPDHNFNATETTLKCTAINV
ncbi:hypothetical protein K503DRAFT_600665 [Rhizopogon vinicolor AM-OR11-026]|uniref:Uncharacterized protein n=1 Tax=Rhizopogon vinicolor AM-OR11-026 TaxID=1314800 RepID=A0A1B7MIU1_9AGAM|nr:hypothetical protein K503DRAFT_600665 [Rhizopogon vinicolor AM-OR11-026]